MSLTVKSSGLLLAASTVGSLITSAWAGLAVLGLSAGFSAGAASDGPARANAPRATASERTAKVFMVFLRQANGEINGSVGAAIQPHASP